VLSVLECLGEDAEQSLQRFLEALNDFVERFLELELALRLRLATVLTDGACEARQTTDDEKPLLATVPQPTAFCLPPALIAMTLFTTDWNVSPDVNAPIPRKMNTNSRSKIISSDTKSSANSCVLHNTSTTHHDKVRRCHQVSRHNSRERHKPQAHGLQHFVTHSIFQLLHCLFEPTHHASSDR
jgi:hypothetical protein